MRGKDFTAWMLSGLGVLLLVFPAIAGSTPLLPHLATKISLDDKVRIIALGSSSTEGIGATSKDKSYPSQLQGILKTRLPNGVVVLNRGIGGEDVDDMMLRLPAIIDEKPDLVIWQTGSNDSLRGVALDHFIQETEDGIMRLHEAGIDVMLMEPQLSQRLAQTDHATAFRDAVRHLGEHFNVPVVRRFDLMQQWLASGKLTYNQMMSGDQLHMTDDGYKLLASAVADLIMADARSASPAVALSDNGHGHGASR
jgi:lysophospholipase L1-like esterase